jgi:RNA polymerase primary sigma factor
LASTVPAVAPDEFSEPVLTLEQVSKDLQVSTKTLSRWRDQGLVTRWVLCDGRRKVGIRQSLLERFLAHHQEQVEKGSRFSQISEQERAAILRRAKRMARVAPDRFTEICRRIAKTMERSVEAIRYTIKKHDHDYPQLAIFPRVNGPLDDQAKQAIYSSFRRGVSINALAKHFRRTRTSMYRIINEMRARRLLSQPLDWIPHPSFDTPSEAEAILAPMPNAEDYEANLAKSTGSVPKGLPPELSALYEVPLLNREQEAHLFRQMNYLKYKAGQIRSHIDPVKARSTDLDDVEDLQKKAQTLKDRLVRANMRLVASIAKRHAGPADNFFELQSDGNLSLLRAVEKFDFSRGNKFSTYASWAIMKNFARSIPDEKVHRDRFMTGYEEMFDAAADVRSDEHEVEAAVERKRLLLNHLMEELDDRERAILSDRYGLDGGEPMTLEQVGKRHGITKERVRQLDARTKQKMLQRAMEEQIELQ